MIRALYYVPAYLVGFGLGCAVDLLDVSLRAFWRITGDR